MRLRKWGKRGKKRPLHCSDCFNSTLWSPEERFSFPSGLVSVLLWFLWFSHFHLCLKVCAHIFTSCVCVRQSSAQCSLPQKQVTHFYDTRCHKAVKRFFHLHIISKRGKTESVRVQSVKIKLHHFNRVKVKHGNKIIQPSGSPAQRV